MRGAVAAILVFTALVSSPTGRVSQSVVDAQSAARDPVSSLPRLVTLDVIASDARGRAVADLKPADFELREDGAVLPIESVRLVRVAAAAQTAPPILVQNATDERQAAVKIG